MQMAVHGKKSSRVAKDMIGDMLVNRDNVCQDCALKDTVPIIAKADDHDGRFTAAQRLGMPVLSGAAVVAVKKLMLPER